MVLDLFDREFRVGVDLLHDRWPCVVLLCLSLKSLLQVALLFTFRFRKEERPSEGGLTPRLLQEALLPSTPSVYPSSNALLIAASLLLLSISQTFFLFAYNLCLQIHGFFIHFKGSSP